MRYRLLALSLALGAVTADIAAESISLEGTDYDYSILIEQEIGPGVRYRRLRFPSYPLNVNLLTVDLTNPYNRIETTIANESASGTESLAKAAERQSAAGHRAIAGANANFWIVASQPEYPNLAGTTRNVSLRNGKIVTESNQHRDQFDWGTLSTGIVALDYDKKMYVDYCTSSIKATNEKIGSIEVHQCNKGVHFDECGMYNSYYGVTKAFMPITTDYKDDIANDATEVILDIDEGQKWTGGEDIVFTVREVRTDAGTGTLGDHDLALVGRGDSRTRLASLAPGDKVTLKCTWTFNPDTDKAVTPLVEQAIGGNAIVMRDGELTRQNEILPYNSQVYSRTGYGTSTDGKTLYIIVIDRSTDPVYGLSAGCNTTKMCEIARHFGCANLSNFDAGGSAEMFVNGSVINKTTESQPRAVANGWLIYSTAPEDDDAVTRIAFNDPELKAPVYSSFEPTVIAYNKYGAVVDYDLSGFTLSCDPSLGSCDGPMFTAGGKPASGMLTAEYNGVTVSKKIDVMEAAMGIRIKSLLIDNRRDYPVEVTASLSGVTYNYNPASLDWTVDNPDIVSIDRQGVMRAHKEGSTSFSCRIGDFSDRADVTVEIPDKARISIAGDEGWNVKGATGMSGAAMSEGRTVTYNYGSPRDASVTLTKAHRFYSLPDRLFIDFTSSIPVERITVDLKTADTDRASAMTFDNDGQGFSAGESHRLELPVTVTGQTDDLIIYPLSFSYIKFTTKRASEYRGTQTFTINDIYAEYDITGDGVNDLTCGGKQTLVSPNPAAPGATVSVVNISDEAEITVCSLSGAIITTTTGNSFTAPAAAGIYIVSVKADTATTAAKLIVR